MNITEKDIEQFFANECNKADAEEIGLYLHNNPTELNKYLNENEWQNFKTDIKLHPAVSTKMFDIIKTETIYNRKKYNWIKYVAAAAILFFGVFGIKYFTTNKAITENKAIAKIEVTQQPILKTTTNKTNKIITILLKDGSVVNVEPNGELKYYEPFENNKRSIYLSGAAKFKVAKDKTKPFTVYSNEIATTAIGTIFSVTSLKDKNTTSVKLYEGKVVVFSINKNITTKQYFLLPGDEFSFNKRTNLAKVITKQKIETKPITTIQKIDAEITNNWFMFNNQSLDAVFIQLSQMYNTTINYNKTDIAKMTFIGKITKKDNVENILNDIALLNNLQITKTNKGYNITKK
ncbi:MAG: FecR family protein [Ferruginibacter sp.]|nr:FecR family protein [Ferruginibacter sp.]